jgi:hypothetical protein
MRHRRRTKRDPQYVEWKDSQGRIHRTKVEPKKPRKRFNEPLSGFRRPNPLTGEEDLGLAFLGIAVLGLVGYGLYTKMHTSSAVAPNPNVTQWNQSTQSAYDNWVMQQIQLGNVTPAQASATGG